MTTRALRQVSADFNQKHIYIIQVARHNGASTTITQEFNAGATDFLYGTMNTLADWENRRA